MRRRGCLQPRPCAVSDAVLRRAAATVALGRRSELRAALRRSQATTKNRIPLRNAMAKVEQPGRNCPEAVAIRLRRARANAWRVLPCSLAQCPLPKFVIHRGTPLTRTSEAKGH